MLRKESPNRADCQGLQIKVHGRVCRWLTSLTALRLQLRGQQQWNKEHQEARAVPGPVRRFKIPHVSQSKSWQLVKRANLRREALPPDRDRWQRIDKPPWVHHHAGGE